MIFKQLPTAISDLNKLGIALKSLDTMNIGAVGVNTANLESYRTALKGLSVEQSVFALASKGATEEQIRQILVTNQATASEVEAAMAKAGLTTATKALTQAEMVEMATKNGVAKAEAEALLSKIGISATEEGQVVVKKQVTLAMLEQAVASGTLTKAEASQIATMLGLNAVETANIGITNVLTASFTKLWAVITAHPIGAILTAVGAVAVGSIAYINKVNKDAEKALVEAHENAEKALEDTKTSLSDDKSELQSINSELEQTKDKIREISSIGTPTLTEQNELDKLSTANAQLETQKSLLENNIKLKQKSAALDAKELLGTQVEMEYSSILDNSSITSSIESYSYADHAKYQASNLKNAYNIYMKALEEGNVRRQELAQELIDASAGNTAELTSKLLEIVESFKYDDGTIIDGYEDIYNEYMGMIYNLQSLTNPDIFLDIAKSITVGTGIDYEKAISEAHALAYEGNFDVDNLNQDFVKALADAGIDESTIDYIFSLKQKEYQLLVDKINNKYKVSEVPDKIKQDYWDANGNIHSEYVDVDEETKNRIEEINTINQSLNDYAKENPVEFQLVTSYDEGFALLDKYIEEEKNKIQSTKYELASLSEQGNVDLTIRPIIDSSAMKEAGWDVEDGSIATTFTQGEFIWQGGEDDGQYVYVHYTPILPDGTVLTPDQLSNYLYGTLESSKNILEADDKGIVLKVDTDLQGVSAEDIKQLQEKGIQTDGMQSFLNSMGQWDDSVHTVQESYYDMSGTVDYVDNAIKRLVEDAKKAEGIDTNETDIFSGFTEAQVKAIDEYKNKMSSIKSSLEKVDDVSMQSGDFTALLKDFPELENMLEKVRNGAMTLEDAFINLSDDALQELYKTVGDGLPQNVKNDLEAIRREAINAAEATKGLKQAFSDIQNVYDVKEEFKKAMDTNSLTDSILSSVAGIDEEMNHLVALFYAGLVSADELYDALEQHYEIDLKNYGNAIIAKNQYSEEFYNKVWLSNNNFVESFKQTYKIDISNCKTYHQAKAKIAAETIQKLGSMWSQYYDAQAMAYTAEYSSLVESAQNGNAQAGMLVGQIHSAVSQYQNAINALNNITYQDLDDNFQNISEGLGDNSNSGSNNDNNNDEIYDWIEVRIKRLQEAYDKLNKKATDTFKSLTKRQSEYENMLSNLGSQRETYIQGINKYEEKLNSIGLSEDWAEKVRNGSIDISTVSDESLKEKIKQYQEWYEKLKNCRDELEDIDSKINEIKITKIQIEIDIDQKKLDKLEAKLDKLQFRLDLSQLFGGLGSASVYTSMNNNIQEQIANLRQQNSLMSEQASLVERGSEAWWEYQNSINSNNSSINQLLQTIAQNAQSIANLRNDRVEQRISELDKMDELTRLRMQNSSGKLNRQNRYVSEEAANITRRQREYEQAVADNKDKLTNSRSAINKVKRNKENKDILKEVKKYTKAKKQIPTSLLEKASKLNDNGVLYTALVNYNAALAALETSQQSADLYDQQSVQDKIDLVRQRMSNIEAYYGNRQGMLDQRATRVNNAMSLAEAQGYATSTAYYRQLRSLENKKRNSLIAERDALQKELEKGIQNGTIRQYSDEWYELVQRIDDVTNAIDESSIALQNYDNQMRQIKWDRFDELQEKIRGISEELNFLINELSRNELTDEDTGWMTAEGTAVATLRLGNYRQYLTLRDDLLKEINAIDKEIEKNPADTKLIARKEELYQRYRDVIQSAQDEKYAIIDLYKQGYDALISRIGTLISEYTDLLDAEKDAYDYQQKIADATKNIATLRKQLTAYAGDISEETRSKIQKITVELEDAEKNLRETQNERMISEQKKMLSEFKDDIQENIQDIIDNLDDNFDKLVSELKNSTSAMETVRDTINNVGYRASDNIDNILNGNNIWKDTKTEIVSIKEQQAELIRIAESIASSVNTDGANNEAGKTTFENDRRSTNSALREAKSKYESYNIEGVKARLAKANEDYSVAGIKYSEQQKIVNESNMRYMNALKKYGSDDTETIRLRKEFESNLDTLNKYKIERDEALSKIKESELQLAEYKRLEKQYNDAKQAKLVMDFLNTRLTTTSSSRNGLNDINKVFYDNYGQRVISDSEIEELSKMLGFKKINGTNSSSDLYKKLKALGIPGFKIGSRRILENQLALLGENGMELQFRKAQGTLGVVGQGDKIFTNEQAENLWRMSKMNVSDFVPNFTTSIPSFKGTYAGNKDVTISIGDIILPDVTNPEQFASALKDVVKNNTSVQRLLKDSTIGTLSRNNSLSIRKY